MSVTAHYVRRTLQFRKPVLTSRGSLDTHNVWYILLREHNRVGVGEAAPLKGLSIDDRPDFEQKLKQCCDAINQGEEPDLDGFPALQFAFETAFRSLKSPHPYELFLTSFLKGEGIPINGLVWMADDHTMLEEAKLKLEQNFTCLKFKVGALDFDAECRLLEAVRKLPSGRNIEIRLDANGAFNESDVHEKLREFSRFHIHSIEQPVKQGQGLLMQEVCRKSEIPVALDEELIGVTDTEKQIHLLKETGPAYLILKPTLLGGLERSAQWIRFSRKFNMHWWATSALESNIGLNAIAQWVSGYQPTLAQGLGTGNLYTNNVNSSLFIDQGKLNWSSQINWVDPGMLIVHDE